MRAGLLGCLALLAGTGMALGQPGAAPPSAGGPQVLPPTWTAPAPQTAPVAPSTGSGAVLPPVGADYSTGGPDEGVSDGALPGGCCEVPCKQPHIWVTGEYLLWFVKDPPLPSPVVTTGPLTIPQTAGSGILGRPGTSVLYGGSPISQDPFSGGRFSAGSFINKEGTIGLEGTFLFLSQQGTEFSAASNGTGSPLLGRPVFDTLNNRESVLLISAPGALSGGVRVTSALKLWGAEANALGQLYRGDHLFFSMLGGFRFLNLGEDLTISQQSRVLSSGVAFFDGGSVLPGSTIGVSDFFGTRNQFYGGQLGAEMSYRARGFGLSLLGKCAVGSTHETLTMNGFTSLSSLGGTQTAPGGLLNQLTNIGRFAHDEFAVLPEGTLTLSYQITPHLRAAIGYTFLYLSNVARPGDQIDRAVNPTHVPTSSFFSPLAAGLNRPTVLFSSSDFWAQGINFGLGYSF